MSNLYPEISPYDQGMLPVSELHTIYYEQSGNPEGIPVIFLHGGPGGGSKASYRQYFDPKKWRIILFDQRGCGKSTPFAELKENTTWDLVDDIEKIKNHLGIKKWVVFGGSWGSTLAMSYGITYPDSCLAFCLRGIFMLRQAELQWFYQEGASFIYPDAWEHYLAPIDQKDRGDLINAFYKLLTGDDEQKRYQAAKAWSTWEGSTSKLYPDKNFAAGFGEDQFAYAFARIECHYFINKGFFDEEDYLLNRIDKISHLPCLIVQGRYDVVCPMKSAWELHKKWPSAQFEIIDDAGHTMSEPGIQKVLVEWMDKTWSKLNT